MPRLHALDALRASMMLLGLVLHSAASYTQTPLGEAWPYHDPRTNVVFDLLVFFIHLFRMPAFFVVAGFFAALLCARDGERGFVRNRVRRVLLPMLLFWPAVALGGIGFVVAVRRLGGDLPLTPVPGQPLIRQPILGHLWFLYYLLIFYAVTLVAVRIVSRVPDGVRNRWNRGVRTMASHTWGAILPGGVTFVTLLPMSAAGLDTSAELFPPLRVLIAYYVFFAFGWLLYDARDLLPGFAARWRSALAGGAAASIVYLYVAVAQPFTDRAFHLTEITLAGIAIWLLIFGLLGLFLRCAGEPRPVVRYLSDASYWMYLVHIVPMIWLNALLATIDFPAAVKFAVVLGGTTLVSIATYHYVVRTTAIGAMLNGKRVEKRNYFLRV